MLQDRRSKLAESRTMMSPVGPNQDGQPVATRAGADLRAARERLGWDLAEVSAALRIRLPHLEALEDGRIDLLPAAAYALGFLRTYAAALGLDPEEIVRRFKAEAGEVTSRTELAFPAPMPERGVPAGAVVLLGLLLAIGAYAGWYRLSSEGRLPPESTAIPHRLLPLAQQAGPHTVKPATPPTKVAAEAPRPQTAGAVAAESSLASAVSPTAASAAPLTAPEAVSVNPRTTAQTNGNAVPAQPQAMQTALAVPPGATSNQSQNAAPAQPGSSATAGIAAQPQAALTGQTVPPATLPTSGSQATALNTSAQPQATLPGQPVMAGPGSAAAQPPQVVLRATADSWVQVRDKSGRVLLNRILHAGDTWQVPPDRPDLVLTTGNAGGTEIEVNGVSSGVLGAPGAVRRDLPLDPALILQGALKPASANGVQQASLHALSR